MMASSSTAAAVSVLLMLIVPATASSSLDCKLDFTSVALLSCQETAPQAPTRSCCDALLYSIDIWPSHELDKGLCCLCVYMVSRNTTFDLPALYMSCGGKDSRSVLKWMATSPRPTDCSDPCGLGDLGAPPPPPPPSGKQQHKKKNQLGAGAIIAIAVACVAGAAFLGWWVYSRFCSPAAKARRSPDPSTSSRHQQEQAGGLEMPRVSSARRSTSALL